MYNTSYLELRTRAKGDRTPWSEIRPERMNNLPMQEPRVPTQNTGIPITTRNPQETNNDKIVTPKQMGVIVRANTKKLE